MRYLYQTIILVTAASCTTPNPNYCPADRCRDTIEVSVTGNDAANGFTAPVKTLRRAIEIATGNGAIKTIRLGTGKYGAANGESYPYNVPANVAIVGAAETVLAGTSAEDGLIVDTATLENLEFTGFATAIRISGTGTVTDVSITTSNKAIVTEGVAVLTATNVTLTGPEECANAGLEALGASHVTVDGLVATDVRAVVESDQASVSIANAKFSGLKHCEFISGRGKSLSVSEAVLTGGTGIWIEGPQLDVTLVNTTILYATGHGISGSAHSFTMTGGELSHSGETGGSFTSGSYTFTNVRIDSNSQHGIEIRQDDNEPGTLAMRGCSIWGNSYGVKTSVASNFGTTVEPGNNTFRGNKNAGLFIYGDLPRTIPAVGNTWMSNVQGADPDGRYSPQQQLGPLTGPAGGNFTIDNNSRLQL